jgi:DNA-binding winged helix-turn-helix (wHTH) protein
MALRAIREEPDGLPGLEPGDRLWLTQEERLARTWLVLAAVQHRRGNTQRARLIAGAILRRYSAREYRSVNGVLYLLLGRMDEVTQGLDSAMGWYRKAHSSFLGEHNWYVSLSVLFAYARVARLQRNYSQALWHLELVENACRGPAFGMMRREIGYERARLDADQVDLLIDSRKGVIKTRETPEPLSLRKQYVLLHILEALAEAHARPGDDAERGLSKAELIEKVWGENYRPQAHDNKLYYNINRLRKLIEREMREPVYVQNWREGYRLGPELRVRWVREDSEKWGSGT